MKITVEVSGWLKKFTKEKPYLELDVNNQGLHVLDIINIVGIPREEIGFITIKSLRSDRERMVNDAYTVSEGDVLRLYSMIVGG